MQIILGIDPGSQKTGFGIIKAHGSTFSVIDYGVIMLGKMKMGQRLATLLDSIEILLKKHTPTILSIEGVFMHKNAQSALKLGQARGCILGACAQAGLDIYEYSPRSIKQAIAGFGGADKNQMQVMVKKLLNLSTHPQSDAADALAAALCHAFQPQWVITQAKETI